MAKLTFELLSQELRREFGVRIPAHKMKRTMYSTNQISGGAAILRLGPAEAGSPGIVQDQYLFSFEPLYELDRQRKAGGQLAVYQDRAGTWTVSYDPFPGNCLALSRKVVTADSASA